MGGERSRIGSVVHLGFLYVVLGAGFQLLLRVGNHQVAYHRGIEAGEDIGVAILGFQGIVREHHAVVLVAHYLPKLFLRVLVVGIEGHAERHARQAARLEGYLQLLAGKDVLGIEVEAGILVAIDSIGFLGSRAVFLLYLFRPGNSRYRGHRADAVRIDVVEDDDGLHRLLGLHAGVGINIGRAAGEHEAALHHAVHHDGLIYLAVILRDVARRAEGIDAGGIRSLAVRTGHGGGLDANLQVHRVGELAPAEEDDAAIDPPLRAPCLGHERQGVEHVRVLVVDDVRRVGDGLVYLVGEGRAPVLVTESREVAEEEVEVHVKRRRKAEGRFLSPVLRGIFEYLVLPLDVVGIELQLVVVAAGGDVVRRLV